ncbi:MAG: MFS transporter [Treponema sp.]|nr:MFS transporter [Treponema sp.]
MADSNENTEAKKEKKENPGKVGFVRNLWWQSRGASLGVNTLMMGWLSIYCTDTLKISPALVGTMLMASKIFDGFTDPIAGFIVDNTNTRLGRGRPYEFAIIGAWLCTWLMFTGSPEWSMFAKCAWVFSMYVLVNSVWSTLLNANSTPYIVRAFGRQEQIVTLSTYGGLVSMVFAVAFNISFPMAMGALATSARGWSTLVAIFAIPLGAIGMLRFIFIKETIVIKNKIGSASVEKLRVKDVVSALKVNPYIFIILILTFTFNIITNMGVGIYYFTYIVNNVGSMGVLAATQIVILPLMFVFPVIIRKFSVIKLMGAGLLVTIVGYVVNYFAQDNMALLITGGLLTGAGVVPIAMLVGLLIIDCAEYNEWKKEARLEGTMGALNGLAGKVGAAAGAGLLGALLASTGYSGSVETAAPTTITTIRMLYSLIPAGIYAVVFMLLRLYKLDKIMPQVRKENAASRQAAAQGGA